MSWRFSLRIRFSNAWRDQFIYRLSSAGKIECFNKILILGINFWSNIWFFIYWTYRWWLWVTFFLKLFLKYTLLFSRKTAFFLSNTVALVGTFFFSIGSNFVVTYLGRILQGFSFGAINTIIPVYLAEISPAKLRGTIVTFNCLSITFGQLIGYLMSLFELGWRIELGKIIEI